MEPQHSKQRRALLEPPAPGILAIMQQDGADTAQHASLVDLPAPCVLAIMRHCSSNNRSLFTVVKPGLTAHTAWRSMGPRSLL
jgi:hypothetical protein